MLFYLEQARKQTREGSAKGLCNVSNVGEEMIEQPSADTASAVLSMIDHKQKEVVV